MNNNEFDDSTVLDMGVEKKTATDGEMTETKEKKKGEWKKVAMGTGAGIVLGAGATVLTGSALLDENEEVELSDEEQTAGYTPLFDDEITMASGVSDDMSFAEAFDAAREEVGPGGVFVWHGNVYSTYTPGEWDNMSEEDIADYSGHFSWSPDNADEVLVEELPGDVDNTPEVVYTAQTSVVNDHGIPVATSVNDDMSFSQAFAAAREEVGPGGAFEWHGNVYNTYRDTEWNNMSQSERLEFSNQAVAAVHDYDSGNHYAQNADNHTSAYDNAEPMVVETSNESNVEVEVLGVEHDYETGGNIGVIAIDGQEVILADVNGDGTFNFAATDLNGDGQLQDNEIENISDMGITVEDLGGTVPAQVAQADYQNEPEVEIIDVLHNEETGQNIGLLEINGQEVAFADVTGDGSFDIAVADLNGDGQIQDNEVQDISDMGLTVNDLLDDPMDNPVYYASNMDSGYDPDYNNSADVSEYLA